MTVNLPQKARNVTVACAQMACTWDLPGNVDRAEKLIREAACRGAQIIQIQELFEAPYFCIEQHAKHFDLASTLEDSNTIRRFRELASSLRIVLPVSWFERAGRAFFNSVAVIDADGSVLGVYRKSHIPNDVGYQEKQYFSPGDTGFRVWCTKYAPIGVAICWDQWFPEAARAMALQGAELLFYPSAIGTDPGLGLEMASPWQRVMQGHAVANSMPLIACNRIGTEKATTSDLELTFFGSSFISDQSGNKVQEADTTSEMVLVHTFDLEACRRVREYWSLFRDRRPDTYGTLLTYDGRLTRGVLSGAEFPPKRLRAMRKIRRRYRADCVYLPLNE
jgi:N-carbamoylputrescine amidase